MSIVSLCQILRSDSIDYTKAHPSFHGQPSRQRQGRSRERRESWSPVHRVSSGDHRWPGASMLGMDALEIRRYLGFHILRHFYVSFLGLHKAIAYNPLHCMVSNTTPRGPKAP